MPHPSNAPLLPAATQIAADNAGEDRWHGLPPGTLVDRAAITRVDGEHVCVQLSMASVSRRDPARMDPALYAFELRATDEAGALTTRTPELRPAGRWETGALTYTWIYVGYGAIQQPTVEAVGHAATDLCVANDGFVTERTRSLSLVATRDRVARRFTWELDPSAAYSAEAIAAGADYAIRPEPPPQLPNVAQRSVGGGDPGSLTALPYPIEQVPGGHPVDQAQLRALLDARFGDLRRCLSRAAEADPSLIRQGGRVVAEFTVGPSGVGNARVTENDFTPAVGACLSRHLAELPIPPDPLRWTMLFRYGVVSRVERRPL